MADIVALPARGIPVSLGQLVQAEPALQRLLEVRLPARTAYHVAKLMALVQAETQHFHAQRETFIRELGTPVPDQPDALQVASANLPAFRERIQELVDVETTLDWAPLSLEELPEMTGADVMALGPLVRA
jgi:hypothetical protein